MANNENLRRLTPAEAREYGRRGGKASGEARRRKANFRKTLNTLLPIEIDSPEWTPVLKALGLESTLETALSMAMIKEGLAGNVKAFEAVARYSGQSDQTDADLKEQEIRIERAKHARDQEIGGVDNTDSIQAFLKAMKPTPEDLESLFDDEKRGEEDAEGEEETSGI